MTSQRHILLSGGTGYIGGRVARALLEHGDHIYFIIRPESNLKRCLQNNSNITYINTDSSDEEALNLMSVQPPDAFVHLATYYRHDLTNLNYRNFLDSNINMPTRWLVLSLQAGCQTIVNTASYWQESDQPPHAATNLYASTKASFESIIAGFVQSQALRAITLRLFDVYGPDDPRPKIFGLVRNAIINNQCLDLTPGRQLHHFTHINDVVDGYMHLLSNLEKYLPIQHYKFDLAGPRASLREAVAIYVDLFGETPTLNWGALPYNSGQIHTPRLTNPLPGWFSKYELKQGLQTLVD